MKKKMNETRTLDEIVTEATEAKKSAEAKENAEATEATEAKENAEATEATEAKENPAKDLATIHINTTVHFKAGPLEDATKELASCFNGIVNNIKEACKVLYRVEREQLWKEGNFKNLGEYAKAIDLNPNLAYKYKDYGSMLEHENETIRKWAESADYTKAVKVKSEDPKRLEEAIKDGTITADTTIKAIDGWKKQGKGKNQKPDILPKYDIQGYILCPSYVLPDGTSKLMEYTPVEAKNVLEAELQEFFKEFLFTSVKDGDTKIYLGIGPSGELATYTRVKHIEPKAKPGKGPAGGPTYAELQAQLAELQAQLANMKK